MAQPAIYAKMPLTQKTTKVGILAIQGDFDAHARMLSNLGVCCIQVKSPDQLEMINGLIVPGGESTTMLKFLFEEKFSSALGKFKDRGGSFFGTCAGAILLATSVLNPCQPSLGLMDIDILRNGYGRQVNSFIDFVDCKTMGDVPIEIVCIRAPIITRIGSNVEILAEHQGHPILVKQQNNLATTFHPELTLDTRIHQLYLSLLNHSKQAEII